MVATPVSDIPQQPRRVLAADGSPWPGAQLPELTDATLVRLYETISLSRAIDARMTGLVRDERIGFYLPARGDEAVQLAVAPLRDTDWVFPSPREQAAWLWRGYPLQQLVDQLFGNAGDPCLGRQLPVHHAARDLRMVSVSAPVGTQIPQAVGAAYAARALGRPDIAMACFGDGSAATGEFHVGLNFAAVWKAPCVLVCRSDGAAGRGGRTLARKALGYGLPAVQVDGQDVLAIWQAVSEAADRARAGGGTTLIEAVVSRAADPAADAADDPLARLRGLLRGRGLVSDATDGELAARHARALDDAIAAAAAKPRPARASMFDDVYEQAPWHLREQRDRP